MDIIIDIETVPDQSPTAKDEVAETISHPKTMSKQDTIDQWVATQKPAAIEAEWRRTSFDGGKGQIVAIGIAIDDNPVNTFFADDWSGREVFVITHALSFIDEITQKLLKDGGKVSSPVRFIGHNLLGFDLPFLLKRLIVLGIKPPACIPFRAKQRDERLFDTMLQWDSKNFVKLDRLAKMLGVGSKGDMDGSMVWDYVAAGRIAEVAQYCADDVELTRAVFRRMTFQTCPVVAADINDLPF